MSPSPGAVPIRTSAQAGSGDGLKQEDTTRGAPVIDELLHSLQADVPGQYNIQLLCLITFPGTIKLPPPIAHVSEGKIRFTFTILTHLSRCLDCAFTAKGNMYSSFKLQKPLKRKQKPGLEPLSHQSTQCFKIFLLKRDVRKLMYVCAYVVEN